MPVVIVLEEASNLGVLSLQLLHISVPPPAFESLLLLFRAEVEILFLFAPTASLDSWRVLKTFLVGTASRTLVVTGRVLRHLLLLVLLLSRLEGTLLKVMCSLVLNANVS